MQLDKVNPGRQALAPCVYEYLVNIACFPVNFGYRPIVLTITPDHYSSAEIYRHIQCRGILRAIQFYLEAVGKLPLQPTEFFDLALFGMPYPVGNDRFLPVEQSIGRKLSVVLDDVCILVPLDMEKGIPERYVAVDHGRINDENGKQPDKNNTLCLFHCILPGFNV